MTEKPKLSKMLLESELCSLTLSFDIAFALGNFHCLSVTYLQDTHTYIHVHTLSRLRQQITFFICCSEYEIPSVVIYVGRAQFKTCVQVPSLTVGFFCVLDNSLPCPFPPPSLSISLHSLPHNACLIQQQQKRHSFLLKFIWNILQA